MFPGMFCRQILFLFILLCECVLPPASKGQAASAVAASPTATNQQIFQVKGVVKELKPDGKTVVIRHEEIPHYMPAMTMPFEVRNTNELRGLKPDDVIRFQLVVTADNGWIEHVSKTTAAHATELPSRTALRVVRDVDPLNINDALPEYHFTNELGQVVNTEKLKGEAFAFTFFFTRCPYPTFCPLMSHNFEDVEKKLLARPNAPTNWHLFSISFDPDYDKPATLKAYAKAYDYQPAHWSFLTGDLLDLTAIGDQVGEYFGHDESGGVTHNLRTVVVDARGRVQKIYPDNKWTSDQLVAELLKAAAVKP